MDHMDNFRERFEALERRTQMVEQRLRWWRGIACGLIVLALLTWALPAGTGEQQGLEQRLAALESLLVHFTRQGDEVFITRANLHLVNGQGTTTTTNGLGNLIVGYNALRGIGDIRTGSHNVVVGSKHNFSSFGGLVVGDQNEIRGRFAAVSGGTANTASGHNSSVSGGGGGAATRPVATTPRSAGGSLTRPVAPSPRSVGDTRIKRASLAPQLAAENEIRPAALTPWSAGGPLTRPVATTPRSAGGTTGRRRGSLTGSLAASSKTSRGCGVSAWDR